MNDIYNERLDERKAKAGRYKIAFLIATLISVLFLVFLVCDIVSQSFGYVLVMSETDPASLARGGVALENLSVPELVETLREGLTRRHFATLDEAGPLASRSREALLAIVQEEIVREEPVKTWSLVESLLSRKAIFEFRDGQYPDGRLYFRSWLNLNLLRDPQSSSALSSGLRGAAIGSLFTIFLTLLIAFPLGVAAAVWLEEYAANNAINRFIQLNIYNLAGVPSIIYGMLGLAIFVRGFEPLTSGSLFGAVEQGTASGRTILSASLTLVLLVLPVIIINAQEALRAVPQSLRKAGLALGATKWQTIWAHVIPAGADRILTGTVLAMSRALGETAPLVVVGASTFLTLDPISPFSRFTTLPIQIYQWTSRPQGEFRNLAAAAILILLILLLTLNATAIIMRNRLRSRRRTTT
ncbi:MAG TPA: phosphate ABC transporter permease PstA [Rectinemataceae bacterium]|nr:phosphate ABC transporter permease PstA [Rectinemataceae bacterium]